MTTKEEIKVTLAGRIFRKATTTTIDQDAFVMKRMRDFGLVEFAASFDLEKDDMNAFSEKLLLQAFETGQLFEILGGVLVEEGVTWSRTVAMTNARFFETLTALEDKEQLFSSIAAVLLDFLVAAAAWSKHSQKFSVAVGGTPIGQKSRTGETQSSTLESGMVSSVP